MEYTPWTVIKGDKIVSYVRKPILTEEEYNRQQNKISDAAQKFMKAVIDAERKKEKEKAKSLESNEFEDSEKQGLI